MTWKEDLANEEVAYYEEQWFGLKQVELGTKLKRSAGRWGVSQATFFRWEQLYGGLGRAAPTVKTLTCQFKFRMASVQARSTTSYV
jgi:hypothetical protein